MNERQIQALQATIRLGATNKAADLIGISQPAVSQLLSSLEAEIGFALFDRKQGRIRPTPQGRLFLDQAQSVLDAFESTRQAAEALHGLSVGSVRVGCTVGFAVHIMPEVLASMHQRRPHINVSLQARPSSQIRDMTQRGIFDLGLFESEEKKGGGSPETQILLPSVCAFAVGDPLAKKRVIHARDLEGRKLVSLYSRHKSSRQLRDIFVNEDLTWAPVFETNLFSSACEFVAHSDAVAIVDPITPTRFAVGQLETRPFRPVVPISLSIIRCDPGENDAFLDELQAEMIRRSVRFGDVGIP